MTTADFREHVARICGIEPLTPRASNPAVVRVPTDRGYYPPKRFNRAKKTKQ